MAEAKTEAAGVAGGLAPLKAGEEVMAEGGKAESRFTRTGSSRLTS